MKKIIFVLMLLLVTIFVAVIVHSAYETKVTTAKWEYQETYDQLNFTGTSNSHSHWNFTDGNYSTYAIVNGTFLINYTKRADYTSSSLWQMKYNTSTGVVTANHSIPSACWGYDSTKLQLKVNASNISNARYCYSGSWTRIGSVKTKQAIYEEGMHWYIQGRTYNISYYLEKPAEYKTFDNAAVNFSLFINDTKADENHTTFNCSILVRYNNTAGYTANVSDAVIANGSSNHTIINFNDGDRVWWYWNCKDNHSRTIFNTSTRIFDVDLVYYTLSLGVGKKINFSLDNGEIVTAGGVTAANLTATDIFVHNLTVMNVSHATDGGCAATENGMIVYNASEHIMYACNSTHWNALW